MFRKIFFSILLFALLISACAPANAQQTSEVSKTSEVSATLTLPATLTPVPTETPTSLPSPTTTPDPNAPEGWTADATHYTKTVDGKITYFRQEMNTFIGKPEEQQYFDLTDAQGNEIWQGWAANHVKKSTIQQWPYPDAIPSVDELGFGNDPVKPAMPIRFFVEDGIKAKYIQHIQDLQYSGGITYTANAMRVMRSRIYGKSSDSKIRDFYEKVFPNQYSIDLTDAQGNPQTINGHTAFNIIFVDDIPNPDFTASNKSGPATSIKSSSIFNKDTNSVTILVTNTKPVDQLSDQEWLDTILIPYGYVICLPYQSEKVMKKYTGNYPPPLSFANMALMGDTHYFAVSDAP